MMTALLPSYARQNLQFSHGNGATLVATDGRKYLDFAAGVAVTSLGHCPPELVQVLQAQAAKLWHVSNLYCIPEQEHLAQHLVALSFADRVFFCNSGAEANEAAIKMARRFHYVAGRTKRQRILTFAGAFHGRTLANLAAGNIAKHMEGFAPHMPGFDQVERDLKAVRAAVTEDIAAIMIEPIQGEGGLNVVAPEFMRGLRALADQHGILLIFDEVQSGIGRTGKVFAHEWSGITPDIMTLAKGLGGGFPVAACLATEAVGAAMIAGSHGSTFGGNPLAMVVADKVLDIISKPAFLARVATKGAEFKEKLAALSAPHRQGAFFDEVRGQGLMIGLRCIASVESGKMQEVLQNHGMLTVGARDNVLRILPPLNASDDDFAQALAIIEGGV
ncbi:MAG: aspartate aminotransferase family protein [Alphaproteobacteria bacterium]|nr:aspartate aminotransferase family protein [Alphaproteobacteria bacterium]